MTDISGETLDTLNTLVVSKTLLVGCFSIVGAGWVLLATVLDAFRRFRRFRRATHRIRTHAHMKRDTHTTTATTTRKAAVERNQSLNQSFKVRSDEKALPLLDELLDEELVDEEAGKPLLLVSAPSSSAAVSSSTVAAPTGSGVVVVCSATRLLPFISLTQIAYPLASLFCTSSTEPTYSDVPISTGSH